MMPSVDKAAITPALVSRLVAAQFPQWAGLPVRPVELDGWDNPEEAGTRHIIEEVIAEHTEAA